jgi:hypothetical protein
VEFELAAVDELKKTNLEYILSTPEHFKYLKDIL